MDKRFYGVTIGLVASVDDPDAQGRVQLRFPWFADEVESGWAPISRPLAGKDRGFYYMPEVDDEALVAFEFGDFNHPIVLGFLHNGVDLPPYNGIDHSVRRVKTVAGHVLEFDDRGGQESVRLHSNGGHQLELRDDPGQIKLSTKSGTTVTIDDTPSQIQLRTVTGVSLTISDTGGVSVSAPTGAVSVNSLSSQVTSTGSASLIAPSVNVQTAMLSVNAALATFSGLVQCQTLVTNAVVSSSYTPGAGNLW